MDSHAAIFGEHFAEEIGRSLLTYFESREFPMQLLRDPGLNSLYLKAQINKILNDKSLSDTSRHAQIDAAFESYYEREGKSPADADGAELFRSGG